MSRLIEDWHRNFAERSESFAEGFEKKRERLAAQLSLFWRRGRPWEIITAPAIYGLIVPFAFLDLVVTAYQRLCFPIYKLPRVERRRYIAFDRQKLSYLNVMQKFNCMYCDYCNGVLAYVREVAGRTEHYWCPIKHARSLPDRHDHYKDFLAYGDGEDWDEKFIEMKERARACEGCTACSQDHGSVV